MAPLADADVYAFMKWRDEVLVWLKRKGTEGNGRPLSRPTPEELSVVKLHPGLLYGTFFF